MDEDQLFETDSSGRFKVASAVYALIIRDNAILLHQRRVANGDLGEYDVAAVGHVEAGESAKKALIRELSEEISVHVNVESLEFAHAMHCYYIKSQTTYYNMYFTVNDYLGEPTINEPDKMASLEWHPIDQLPDNLLLDRRQAIEDYHRGVTYSEVGWAN